jgi:hydroxyacylglutathione hydrolase
VFETHVQADHVSGLPELVARTGAAAYLPEGAGVEFDHRAVADGDVVKLGNTELQAVAAATSRGSY